MDKIYLKDIEIFHLDDGDFVTIIGEKGTESIFSKQRNGDTQE